MIDMTKYTVAKSDQMNASDFGPTKQIIRITKVVESGSHDQPVHLHYDGGEGRPWKPCKSMMRALIYIWGENGLDYVGRSLELYNDPSVTWGGQEVGGIRIARASHMLNDQAMTFPLMVARGKRVLYTVEPLIERKKITPEEWVSGYEAGLQDCADLPSLTEYQSDERRSKWVAALKDKHPELHKRVVDANSKRFQELSEPEGGRTDEQHGDQHDGGEEA